jgi:hypothetical protein
MRRREYRGARERGGSAAGGTLYALQGPAHIFGSHKPG